MIHFLGLFGISAIIYALIDIHRSTESGGEVLHKTNQFWEVW